MVRALLVAVLLVLAPSAARAQPHVIGPGHESTVVALFSPYALAAEIEGGFRLWDIAIEQSRIRVGVRNAAGDEGHLLLTHPEEGESGTATSSFVITIDDASVDASRPALAALVTAAVRNDAGGFWDEAEATVEEASTGARRVSMWGRDDWVPIDGIAMILGIWLLGLVIALRLLSKEPRWMAGALGATVLGGVVLRFALSPAVFLGAWPWTRLYPNVAAVADGSWLASYARWSGEPVYLTDVMLGTNLGYATAMPLVLFGHATYLLRDARAGLLAAIAVALLPQHIRFSHCEDGFVGSLVLTSLAFALIHGWLRDESPTVRGFCLFTLPWVLYPGFLLRPLNILFIVVYVVALGLLHVETAPRGRRLVGVATVVAVGAIATQVFLRNGAEAAQSVDPARVLADTLGVLASPRLLVLSDPTRTPPALILLALLGAVLGIRGSERRVTIFLLGWLLLFVGAHAVVIQESMQPRYHLHLVVPFLLLAALGVTQIPKERLDDRRVRLALALGAASIFFAPLLHRAFIDDRSYTEIAEYEHLRAWRDAVPAGCTVIEPALEGEVRFERLGDVAGSRDDRFEVVSFDPRGDTAALDAVLESPPECLFVYEGIACAIAAEPCASVMRRFPSEVQHEAHVPVRWYDGASDPDGVLAAGADLHLRLSRVRPR